MNHLQGARFEGISYDRHQQFSVSVVPALQRAVSADVFFCPIFPTLLWPPKLTRMDPIGTLPCTVSASCVLPVTGRRQLDSGEQKESGPGCVLLVPSL